MASVRIETLYENTFYAVVSLHCGNQTREVDARPSDAIAIALLMNRPIYVNQAVMEQAGKAVSPDKGLPIGRGLAHFRDEQEAKQKEKEKQGLALQERLQSKEELENWYAKQRLEMNQLIASLFDSVEIASLFDAAENP